MADQREQLIEAATEAIYRAGQQDRDVARFDACTTLDAVLPLIADDIQSEADREQWAFNGDTSRFWEGVTAGKARAATMVRSWITS